jgi:ferredoxin-type protein NapH
MRFWRNVSVIRKLAQTVIVLFLVFGASVVGVYSADKITTAFPALTCAYDGQSADYCVLVPVQRQSGRYLGSAILGEASLWTGVLTVGLTLATFLILFVLFNKAFCGWACPLGFFQELLAGLGQKLGIRQPDGLPEKAVRRIRPAKWFMLAVLVFGLPIVGGMGLATAGFANSATFCSVCPSRFLTTLATGDLSQFRINLSSPGTMFWTGVGVFLFGLIITLGMTLRQPFCRICPMLALHAAFRKLGLVRLVKKGTPRCEKCGLCARACPMDIREIHTEMHKRDVTFPDCTLCGRCVEFCPDKDVLQIRYAGMPLFSSSPAYFKERKKAQVQWEKIRFASFGVPGTAGEPGGAAREASRSRTDGGGS